MAEDKQKVLTEGQVNTVMEFAQYLYPAMMGQNVYTPEMLYNNLLNLNVLPKKTDYDKLVRALENAKKEADNIQGYSQYLEQVNMTYKKTLEYYTNLLSFDYYYTVREAGSMTAKDWKSKEFQEDLRRLERFFTNFSYKREFRDITKDLLRREVVYTWFRRLNTDSPNAKYTLEKMPQDKFIMTGYWEGGILSDFDMQYFLQPGVDIDAYDPKFKDLFMQAFGDFEAQEKYIPTNPFNARDGAFATYVQLSPTDGAFTFKFDTSNFETVPFLAPYMKNILYEEDMQKLQRDKNMLSAMAILVGEIDTLNKQKSGETQNATAFTSTVMGEFMRIVRMALNDSKIKVAALPLVEAEWRQFEDKNKEMYNDAIKTTAGTGVSASSVIYSTEKSSQAEVEAQLTADYNVMKKLYEQFNYFVTFWVNKKMKKYHFDITFDGCTQPFERQYRIDSLMTTAETGFVPNESYIASCLGVPAHQYTRMLLEASNGGLTDRLTPLTSIFNGGSAGEQTGGKRGRPRKRRATKTESRDYDDSNR